MPRVVVFIGGSRDIAATVQRALPDSVAKLSQAGVVIPRAGRRYYKGNGFIHQKLPNGGDAGWDDLTTELRNSPAHTVLLVVPGLLKLSSSDQRRAIIRRLKKIGTDVCVVSVVTDQLTLINESYLQLIATWRISRRLDKQLSRMLNSEIFLHETMLRPWYESAKVRYAAIAAPDYAEAHPVTAVLHAAGVETPELELTTPIGERKLGPVGVEANRLLATYLRADIENFKLDGSATVVNRAAMERSDTLGWLGNDFWGWTPKSATKAVAMYDASNHRFAKAVWGTDWPIPYPLEWPSNQIDFLDLDPPTVDQIYRYVVETTEKLTRAVVS